MDDLLRQRVLAVAKQLAVEEKDRLAALGTFAEIQELSAEIGDAVIRPSARLERTRRAEAMIGTGGHASLYDTSFCPEGTPENSPAIHCREIVAQEGFSTRRFASRRSREQRRQIERCGGSDGHSEAAAGVAVSLEAELAVA